MPLCYRSAKGCEKIDLAQMDRTLSGCGGIAGAQNWNGATDTVILPSDDCWTVKFTSFEAFVSPTVTDNEPLHFNVRLSAAAAEKN
jgi:hypothetical protein